MNNLSAINNILIVGGTHGNELSGVQSVSNWLGDTTLALNDLVPSANLHFHLANKGAIKARARFVEEDLNRQFTFAALDTPLRENSSLEKKIAQQFNQAFGPKSPPTASKVSATDFIIDIHNTTSNMGPTLIILVNDEFHQQLARYVKTHMPVSNILIEDQCAFEDNGYLCSVGKKGVMIEVGPQAHGTVRALLYQQTVEMTKLILAYIENVNSQQHKVLPEVEAFRLGTEIAYPIDAQGNKVAMIHPNLDAKDFTPLINGQACFVDFEGNDIVWQGKTTYPHFIGEAAYDHLKVAFATADKCMF